MSRNVPIDINLVIDDPEDTPEIFFPSIDLDNEDFSIVVDEEGDYPYLQQDDDYVPSWDR